MADKYEQFLSVSTALSHESQEILNFFPFYFFLLLSMSSPLIDFLSFYTLSVSMNANFFLCLLIYILCWRDWGMKITKILISFCCQNVKSKKMLLFCPSPHNDDATPTMYSLSVVINAHLGKGTLC